MHETPKEQARKIVSALVGPEDGEKVIDALEHAGFMFLRRLFLEESEKARELGNGEAL